MSDQAEEWYEMSQQERDEIRARLIAACETRANLVASITRQRLERASRVHLGCYMPPQ